MSSTAPRSSRQPCANGPPRNAPEMKQRPAADRFDARRLGEEVGERGIEPVRQHHERADAGLADRVDDGLRPSTSTPSGFSSRSVLPAARPRDREVGLRGGRDRDRDRVAHVEERVEVVEAGACSCRAELLRVRGGARPHPGHAGLRPGGEHRAGHHPRPRARADEADRQGLRHGPTLPLRRMSDRSTEASEAAQPRGHRRHGAGARPGDAACGRHDRRRLGQGAGRRGVELERGHAVQHAARPAGQAGQGRACATPAASRSSS